MYKESTAKRAIREAVNASLNILTTEETAAYLRSSTVLLRRLTQAGEFPRIDASWQ
jgi:hypothetical protein